MAANDNPDALARLIELMIARYHEIESSLPLLSRELNPMERRALKVVNDHQKVAIGAIGSALAIPPSTTTWLVGRLVEREIFKRTRDAKDRRKVWIELSGKGEALARLMERIPDRIAADLLYKLEEGDRPRFVELVQTVISRIEEAGGFK